MVRTLDPSEEQVCAVLVALRGEVEDALVIYYVAPIVLGAGFVGLCLVLAAEQRSRRRR